jgi:hypothetical protein
VGNFRRLSYLPKTDKIIADYPTLAEWTQLDEIIEKMLKVDFLHKQCESE